MLQPDEFLVQIIIPVEYLRLPDINIKKRRQSTIGYPLVSIAANRKDDQIRFAISGLSDFPFRSHEMEEEINRYSLHKEMRIQNAINNIPHPVKDNLFGSADYRKLLIQNTLLEVIDALEVRNENL